MLKRRDLTPYERKMAATLRAIWDAKKKALGLSQESASEAMGFSSQSSVSQYLNAKIPLNTDAKLQFAKLLHVNVHDFDPEFDKGIAPQDRALIIEGLRQVLSDMTPEQQAQVEAFAKGLMAARKT